MRKQPVEQMTRFYLTIPKVSQQLNQEVYPEVNKETAIDKSM